MDKIIHLAAQNCGHAQNYMSLIIFSLRRIPYRFILLIEMLAQLRHSCGLFQGSRAIMGKTHEILAR